MRKFVLAIALLLAGSSTVWAGGITGVQDSSTPFQITATVFNDSGSALTSGSVVIWDNDDTEFDRTGFPYVTTTTTTDDDWVAGVTLDNSCADQTLCTIVVYGWARTNIAQATDVANEDTPVATTSVAGQAGDYGPAANTCLLGLLTEWRNLDTGAHSSGDLQPMGVFVNPTCQ